MRFALILVLMGGKGKDDFPFWGRLPHLPKTRKKIRPKKVDLVTEYKNHACCL